jgi:hypothetical protein
VFHRSTLHHCQNASAGVADDLGSPAIEGLGVIVRDESAFVIAAVMFRPFKGVTDERIPHQVEQMDARDGSEKCS